jgi:hypothetical protein
MRTHAPSAPSKAILHERPLRTSPTREPLRSSTIRRVAQTSCLQFMDSNQAGTAVPCVSSNTRIRGLGQLPCASSKYSRLHRRIPCASSNRGGSAHVVDTVLPVKEYRAPRQSLPCSSSIIPANWRFIFQNTRVPWSPSRNTVSHINFCRASRQGIPCVPTIITVRPINFHRVSGQILPCVSSNHGYIFPAKAAKVLCRFH